MNKVSLGESGDGSPPFFFQFFEGRNKSSRLCKKWMHYFLQNPFRWVKAGTRSHSAATGVTNDLQPTTNNQREE